jgi:hypothetical protein
MVHREVAVDSANRPDIVLTADGIRVAVIEVKVLAGLGPRQLAGYQTAEPGRGVFVTAPCADVTQVGNRAPSPVRARPPPPR